KPQMIKIEKKTLLERMTSSSFGDMQGNITSLTSLASNIKLISNKLSNNLFYKQDLTWTHNL
ncbi:hypothetical protein ACJX0J_015068, partial [Zea mays]